MHVTKGNHSKLYCSSQVILLVYGGIEAYMARYVPNWNEENCDFCMLHHCFSIRVGIMIFPVNSTIPRDFYYCSISSRSCCSQFWDGIEVERHRLNFVLCIKNSHILSTITITITQFECVFFFSHSFRNSLNSNFSSFSLSYRCVVHLMLCVCVFIRCQYIDCMHRITFRATARRNFSRFIW